MKLLYITNGINGSGGLERVLSIKASYLADLYDYEVTILSLNDNHLKPFYKFSDKIKRVSIPVSGNFIQYLKSYRAGLVNMINEMQPDIISVCDDGLKGFLIPTIINVQTPIIYERHASVNLNFKRGKGNLLSLAKNKLQHFIMKQAARKFNKFVVLTSGNLKEWKGDNLVVVPNPLSFYPKESAALQSMYVIAVGSHSYNKGYDLLLLVWQRVISQHPNWVLNIYGKIDSNQTYLKQAETLGLVNNINFYNPVKDIQSKYLESTIMVLPSRSEGFGMVLIEAMACGVPCVSFDCPEGPADIIRVNEDGFLVDNGNVDELARKIITLIEDETLRKKMGSRAKENVQRYLPEEIVQQWDALFKSLVE